MDLQQTGENSFVCVRGQQSDDVPMETPDQVPDLRKRRLQIQQIQ
jgi:hypothetical protein